MLRGNCFSLVLCLLYINSLSQLRLPQLLSDGVVLQREVELTLFGWSSPHEHITLYLDKTQFTSKADDQGYWHIKLPPHQAGGPHTLRFVGPNEVIVTNVLFGDVWICSGQSNMELTIERVKEKYRDLIRHAYNPYIRHFDVPDRYNFKHPQNDIAGGKWLETNPVNLLGFSAVAWFFANELYRAYQVPIGLINASVGGSPAEAWLSEDALHEFPEAYAEMQRFKNDTLILSIESADNQRISAWYNQLDKTDPGIRKWNTSLLNDSDWDSIKMPSLWPASSNLKTGSVWLRKTIEIPPHMCDKPGSLWLGRIVDADSVFLNDYFIGTTSYQYPPRRYTFSAGTLMPGKNFLSVRVISTSSTGGFVPDKPYFLAVDNDTISLEGFWKYKQGSIMHPLQPPTFIRWKPGGLYNGMIAPLTSFKIKGVIWYQGEANTHNPTEYFKLFPSLIKNWREKWNIGEFPFLFVQLASFMEPRSTPSESNWAAIRQAQLETLQIAPRTAMVVTIDVGEWNDIHPLDKQTVGKRLALAARNVAYNEKKLISSGPLYKSHRIKNDVVIIRFSHTGKGLTTIDNLPLKYFSIAGSDGVFHWANAIIKGKTVMVWNKQVSNPIKVRYAWADNPSGANLYNKEGLPASPFTTK